MQAVESELLGVLTAAADRAGCNKSLLVVGPRGAGKTLVRPRRGLHAWAWRRLRLDVSHTACAECVSCQYCTLYAEQRH